MVSRCLVGILNPKGRFSYSMLRKYHPNASHQAGRRQACCMQRVMCSLAFTHPSSRTIMSRTTCASLISALVKNARVGTFCVWTCSGRLRSLPMRINWSHGLSKRHNYRTVHPHRADGQMPASFRWPHNWIEAEDSPCGAIPVKERTYRNSPTEASEDGVGVKRAITSRR